MNVKAKIEEKLINKVFLIDLFIVIPPINFLIYLSYVYIITDYSTNVNMFTRRKYLLKTLIYCAIYIITIFAAAY